MEKILIATSNIGKFNEISSILEDLPIKLIALKDIHLIVPEEIEDGKTYQENAYKKANYCAKKCGVMTLADDSGLIVDALKGELGVFTRRWGAGNKASDEEWIKYFLERIKNEQNRTATFVCCVCLVDNKGKVLTTARGETNGLLSNKLEAPIKAGIPLSSVFKAEGTNKVHSNLSIEEKNKISHRGKAMNEIKCYLKQYFVKS